MNYLYGMRLRGASPGAQPNGFEIVTELYRTLGGSRYYDILRYDRILTEDEQNQYDLDYLGYYKGTSQTWAAVLGDYSKQDFAAVESAGGYEAESV